MKSRSSLTRKILFCALVNLVLLAGAVLAFIRIQFEMGPESILMAPGQTKARMLAEEIIGEMGETAPANRTAMLARYEEKTGFRMGLFLNNGQAVGGSVQTLPDPIMKLLRPRPPGPGGALEPPPQGPKLASPPRRRREGEPPPKRPGPEGRHPVFLANASGQYWMGLRIPIVEPGQEFPYLGTLILRSPTLFMNPLLFDIRPWLLGALVLLGITLVCWIPLIRGLTGSLRQIKAGAEQIAGGHFDVKLPANRRDEIDQLSEALNRMAVQLDGFVHGQKRFLGDIAHELSAPIARTQMALGILEDRVDAPNQSYVDGLREEVQQMSGLVNELLQFSKAGLRADQSPPVQVRVGEIVQKVLDREVTSGFNVRLTEGDQLSVLAQPDGLFRALSNVVRNAIRYAGQDGPITIAAQPLDGNVIVVVADQGPGLPEDAVERVFAPFYRLERSRSRESGGTGLGLAIVRACVESSGGNVFCRNRSPRGLEVCISLKAVAAG